MNDLEGWKLKTKTRPPFSATTSLSPSCFRDTYSSRAVSTLEPPGDEPWSVAIGDLDGINGPDLAVANSSSDDVSVLLNACTARACPADLDGSGDVDFTDLLAVLAEWGTSGSEADLDEDGMVGLGDLLLLLLAWGPCE